MGGFEALTRQVPGRRELEATSRIHHALSDPLRLTILHLLKRQHLCVCVINRFIRIGGSKLSYHLGILKESGLIEGHYEGNWIIYSITGEGRNYLMFSRNSSECEAKEKALRHDGEVDIRDPGEG